MTGEKIKEVLELYAGVLIARKWPAPGGPPRGARCEETYDRARWFDHCLWMCRRAADVLLPGGDRDKAMRWMCFVQGVLYAENVFTIDDLRAHSRA